MHMTPSKRTFITLFLVVATELIGFGLIIPILPQLGLRLQVNHVWLGVLMAAYSAAQFIAAPILGSLSDRYGRKPILLLSKFGTLIGYGVLAVSNSYGLFLLSRLIDGFTGGNISVARAYVSDITTPENRHKGMALIGIAFGVGFTLGPALGGLLYGIGNGQWVPAMAAAGFSAIALVMTYFFLEEPKERRASSTPQHTLFANLKFIKGRFVALILLIQLLYMVIFSGFETTFAVFTNYVFSFTEKQNSLLFVFAGIMTMLVQGVITRRTFSNPKTMLLMGISFTSVAFALLASTQSITLLLVGLAALSLGMGLVGAYLPSLLSTHVNSNIQGGAMGIYEGIGSLSRVIGPIATFGLFAFSPNGTYGLFAGALAIIGILILLIYSPKTKHDLPQH